MSARAFAPAKINLTLRVGPPRADGYHPLESLVAFADVGDWVEAAPANALALSVSGPFADALSTEPNNLVLRAARALCAEAGRAPQVALRLEKNLPIASGIGGGSADAAAALRACNAALQLGADEPALMAIARQLGADVPVCLLGRSAWMTGVGEHIAPMALPKRAALLINPRRPLATPAVFRAFDESGAGSLLSGQAPLLPDEPALLSFLRAAGNDLEPPAISLMPVVGEILSALRSDARVRYAALSGSGATCFAVTDDAAALAREWSDKTPFWVCATTLAALDPASPAR